MAYPELTDRTMTNDMMPPYSASVFWAHGMLERAADEVADFRILELPIEEADDTQSMLEKYAELTEILNGFKDDTFNDWCKKMNEEASGYVDDFVVKRPDPETININFNAEVISCLELIEPH